MKNPWILPAAALALGAAGGFISGKNSGADDASTAAEQAAERTRSSSRSTAATAEGDAKRSSRAGSLEEAYRIPGSSSRVQALLEFYSTLTPEQLADEAKKLENLPMSERMVASFLLFGRWAEVDPTAAMAFSNTMGFAGAFVRPTILQSWASTDPANAAKYYTENPGEFAMMNAMGGRGGMGNQGPASIIAGEWARQDPDAALAWANSLEQGKGPALASVVSEVAKNDPKKAIELLAKMDEADRVNAYGPIARQYGASNFEEALSWINTLPADQRDAARGETIRGLATVDPEAAAAQIAKLPASRETEDLVSPTVQNWSREDPEAAAAWLMSQESERAKRQAMDDLIPSWTAKDPAAALAFVNSQPAGEVRDSAVTSVIESNTSADPSTLTTMAESVSDDRDRGRTVATLYTRWKQTNPTAADAYLQQTQSIPDNMKQRISEGRGRWGGPPGR